MGALATGRVTPQRSVVLARLPVSAGAVIFAGALVVQNVTGYAAPGTAAAGLRSMGRCEQTVDNSEGADGDASVVVRREGTFLWRNASGADQVTLQDLNQNCYILDDQTVARDSGAGARSPAGTVAGVEEAGVWVDILGGSSAEAPVSGVGGARKILVNRTDDPMDGAAETLDLPDPPAGQEWIYLDVQVYFRFGVGVPARTGHSSGLWIKDGDAVGSVARSFGGSSVWEWNYGHQDSLVPGYATWAVGVINNPPGAELYTLEYDPGNNRLSFFEAVSGAFEPTVVYLLVWGVSG